MSHYRATSSPALSIVEATAERAGSRLARHGVRAGAVLFAAVLTGAAAQFAVSVPWTAVPFTMQPVAVLLAGAVLGARLGALSQMLYLALGVTGAAMFALSPVLAPWCGPPARADRRLPAGVSAGRVRCGMAGRPRLDAHLRRRGGGDAGRAGGAVRRRRGYGWRRWPGRRAWSRCGRLRPPTWSRSRWRRRCCRSRGARSAPG